MTPAQLAENSASNQIWNPTTEDIEHQKFLNVLHDVKGLYNRKKLSFFEITPRAFIQLLVGIVGLTVNITERIFASEVWGERFSAWARGSLTECLAK